MTKIDKFKYLSLKESLEDMGYLFPCSGKGMCGKCRIIAPALKPTPLDKRFLNRSELSEGIRLACDKETFVGLEIDCRLGYSSKTKLENPQIIAIIRKNHVDVGIVDSELIRLNSYPITSKSLLSLRSVIGKNSIEFYEHFSVAKANEILVLASYDDTLTFTGGKIKEDALKFGEYYDADEFAMPSELVYLPPLADKRLGSLFLSGALTQAENTVLIDVENSLISYKCENNLVAAPLFVSYGLIEDIEDGLYSNEAKAFLATIRYFSQTFTPKSCYLLESENSISTKALSLMIKPYGINISAYADLRHETAVELLNDARTRTKLEKLARVTVYLDKVAQNDLWQRFFSE